MTRARPRTTPRGLAENTNGHRDRAALDLAEAVRLDPENQQFATALKEIKP
jgi:hypothetical protein